MDTINTTNTTATAVTNTVAPKNSINANQIKSNIASHTDIAPKIKEIQNNRDGQIQNFSNNTDIEESLQQERLEELINELNAEYNPLNLNVSFAYDENIHSLYVEVKRIDTGEVLRQIPSEEALKLMAVMKEIQGVIFDVRV